MNDNATFALVVACIALVITAIVGSCTLHSHDIIKAGLCEKGDASTWATTVAVRCQ